MATRRQPLRKGTLLPGTLVAGMLTGLSALIFATLWLSAPAGDRLWLLHDRWLRHVLAFSLLQALLSALLSVVPAIPLSRALYRRRFPGRQHLLRLCNMTLVLPVLAVVSGLTIVYGREGWLTHIIRLAGGQHTFSLYGLHGILLAHVFFNLPLASRLLLQALEHIPSQQRQLAAQLNIRGRYFFRLVEWPSLRQQLMPVFSLIFMLCFSSFAIVMTLGGGPRATTLELAIFQALSYDYDPARAAWLSLLQLFCCLTLLAISQRLYRTVPSDNDNGNGHWHNPQDTLVEKLSDGLLIVLMLLLLLPPLLAVVAEGLNPTFIQVLSQPALWQALWTSLYIALAAGLLCLLLTVMLLWSSRELFLQQKPNAGRLLEMSGMLILAMPGFVLAAGLFLLLQNTTGLPMRPDGIVIFTNALMAMPYAIKTLQHPMRNVAERYGRLCLSLQLYGGRRLCLIEIPLLKQPLARALAFACVLSLGDFGVVALFGSEHFTTLPFLLYQQAGAYQQPQSAVTALILLLLCFILFTLMEKTAGSDAKTT